MINIFKKILDFFIKKELDEQITIKEKVEMFNKRYEMWLKELEFLENKLIEWKDQIRTRNI